MSAPFQPGPSKSGKTGALFRLSSDWKSPFPACRLRPVADRRPDLRADYARYSTIGVEFAAIVGILGWLGHLLDGWLFGADGFPVFLLVGLFAGMIGGILRMNRQMAAAGRKDDESPSSDADDRE